ncbi:DNA cytosine methyltransferase [Propionispora hippei]|uniref:Cytosine-specific methyltransferase n=1 Tax=Propionispora hippei DSM 15287 TaxID=1123003 RepID=A0A1M6HPG4_9FIRM|nr:DNA cytosine methyltransferase [Propionispora hippei]SHJ24131.1 DNA (cytosine-5)-methyltransferase 1 [Propionispora hippei DSM 15287]
MLQILELFGGIGSPRIALRNMGIPVKSIDYVEIDEKAVRSYNAMFTGELPYKTQDVCGWNLRPDILIHGSPCQDFSIAGHQGRQTKDDGRINYGRGADRGSGTRSSLMWETINIIRNMGAWRPKVVVWENVKNVLSKRMNKNFRKYISEMDSMGYTSNFKVLNAMDFGLPQKRERVFTVSMLGGEFDFSEMEKRPVENLEAFLQPAVDDWYTITAPSMVSCIGKTGVLQRITIIKDFCYTITERPDRAPGCGCLPIGNGKYRYLTERECWRLQGYSDEDFDAAATVNSRRALYKQAGNSIPVPIFESMFDTLLNGGKKIYSSQQTLF